MSGRLSTPMRVVLVLSLAVNLFAIGAVAADAVMHRGWLSGAFGLHDHHRRFMGMPSPHQLRAVLPESGRVILEDTLNERRPKFREQLKNLFTARRAVADAIGAEPFDRARLDAAFATLREREASVAEVAQSTITELAVRLDADGRAKVADLLLSRRKGRQ